VNNSSLLLEIGTEDLPARFLPYAIQQLKENVEIIFKENHIKFSGIKTYGTPRRLAVIADGIALKQEDKYKEVFGPSKKVAFDEKSGPTKAAIGFANSQGVNVESLIIKNKDKREYVVAVIEEKGVYVSQLLPEILKRIVLSMHFPKSMRWGDNNIRFVRPIRW
jgi:glycyl-tRNA synthetase beta chain